jgi:membrane-associated phospholipid phosphatase
LTNAQILALDPLRINSFDRSAILNHSSSARKASDVLLVGGTVLPLILLADKNMRSDASMIGTMYAETFLVNYMLTDIIKKTTLRTRPLAYNPSFGAERFEQDTRMSFFSGHTSSVAASSFFTASIWQKYHPDSKLSPLVWATAVSLPAITGYARYRAGKHFPTDVLVGYLVGAGIGLLVPHLHQKVK